MRDLIDRAAAIGAIQTLIDNTLHNFEVHYASEKRRYKECLEVIELLPPAQPETAKRTAESTQNVSNEDLISRKMAIDALAEIGSLDTEADIEYAIEVFELLPSAQPEIIRCKDCKHWTFHKRLEIPWCRVMHIDRGANCFCSDAERRNDEDKN